MIYVSLETAGSRESQTLFDSSVNIINRYFTHVKHIHASTLLLKLRCYRKLLLSFHTGNVSKSLTPELAKMVKTKDLLYGPLLKVQGQNADDAHYPNLQTCAALRQSSHAVQSEEKELLKYADDDSWKTAHPDQSRDKFLEEHIKSRYALLSMVGAVSPPTSFTVWQQLYRVQDVMMVKDIQDAVAHIMLVLISQGRDWEAWLWFYTMTEDLSPSNDMREVSRLFMVPFPLDQALNGCRDLPGGSTLSRQRLLAAAIPVQVRIIFDLRHLRALRNSGSLIDRLPLELWEWVRGYLARSNVLAGKHKLLGHLDRTPFKYERIVAIAQRGVRELCRELMGCVDQNCHSCYWYRLTLGTDESGFGQPKLAIQIARQVLAKTPGAVDFVETVLKQVDRRNHVSCSICDGLRRKEQ